MHNPITFSRIVPETALVHSDLQSKSRRQLSVVSFQLFWLLLMAESEGEAGAG